MKNTKGLSLLLIPVLLTSCSGNIPLEYVPFSSYIDEVNTTVDSDTDNYYQKKDTTGVTYHAGEINSAIDLLSVNTTGNKRSAIDTTGEKKLLVVPVYFNDSNKNLLEKKHIYIQNAFFGETKMTEYDSVAGYYNKSSYGKLRLTGEVAPWYNIGINSNEWSYKLSSTYQTASSIIAARAVDYIRENNSEIDLSQYDTDDDGNIDAIYVIYDHPFEEQSSKKEPADPLYWAYVYYTYLNDPSLGGANKTEPCVNAYAWTSVNSITDIGNANDCLSYTNYLIHETGHLLGLSDYYNTFYTGNEGRKNSGCYQPTGLFDMMDYNVGDHTAFSKYLLKWTSPKVVKHGTNMTYKMSPFNTSGDLLLIPSSSYADSPYGEYLLVEFFSPTGLNKCGQLFQYYVGNGDTVIYSYPNHYGIKIYHVNAQLAYFKQGSLGKFICKVSDYENHLEEINKEKAGIDYLYDNSITDSEAHNGAQVLYHLLESSGSNTFIDAMPATNDTLFKTGDDFGITTFKDFKFSDGNETGFTLKVKSVSSSEATLEITLQ